MRVRAVLVSLMVAVGLVGCGLPGLSGEAPDNDPPPATTDSQPAATATPEGLEPVVLIIDGSGTMKTEDVAPSRMVAAKQAAAELIKLLPEGTPLAVVTYGNNVGNSAEEHAASCQDITTVVELTELTAASRTSAANQINQIDPRGFTPIAGSLTHAAGLLPDGAGTIILLSDGEDTCAPPDPCETATALAADNPDLTISTIGLSTAGIANPQLACIANEGRGLFVTAADVDDLIRRLQAALQGPDLRSSLSTTGLAGVQIGASHADVVIRNPSFPLWEAAAPFPTAVPGLSETLVEIIWQDCSYVFAQDSQTLLAIIPQAASTVDGIAIGDSATTVQAIYGEPVEVDQVSDGWTARYWADKLAGTSFSITYPDDPRSTLTTQVRQIYLCRCLPVESSKPDATTAMLATMEVPANCDLPAQRLVDGATTLGEPGEGWVNYDGNNTTAGGQPSIFVDLTGEGYLQGFSVYSCHAGGVSWPESLVLSDSDGSLLAWFDLQTIGQQGKAHVTSMVPQDNGVLVSWDSYRGAGFDMQHFEHLVNYDNGELVLS